jgi:Domain of unknown function (DUF4395)
VRDLFTFPNPVNEKAARTVAGVGLATAVLILVTGWYWLLIPLCYGFWARFLTGPTLSPLGWAAQNVIAAGLESIAGFCVGCQLFGVLCGSGSCRTRSVLNARTSACVCDPTVAEPRRNAQAR